MQYDEDVDDEDANAGKDDADVWMTTGSTKMHGMEPIQCE